MAKIKEERDKELLLVEIFIGVIVSLLCTLVASFYECDNCHYKYVPPYKRVLSK